MLGRRKRFVRASFNDRVKYDISRCEVSFFASRSIPLVGFLKGFFLWPDIRKNSRSGLVFIRFADAPQNGGVQDGGGCKVFVGGGIGEVLI